MLAARLAVSFVGGMRQARLKVPASRGTAFYHCVSRVVDRQFVFGPPEKEQFLKFMREYEAFCGVRIITFCILSNHFHLLVEVPPPPAQPPADEELLRRVEQLSGAPGNGTPRQLLERFRQQGDDRAAEQVRAQLLARMGDISAFMKLLKQRFTQWFNARHHRTGTLWEGRFKSVLVEGAGTTLATMAAYIDLNPVRAGLVEDPKDYRWGGYAEALAGSARAQAGLQTIVAGAQHVAAATVPANEALAQYRQWLFAEGEAGGATDERGEPRRRGLSPAAVAEVIRQKGRVPLTEYVRIRVRAFTDGAVLGSRRFVDGIFDDFRRRFGPRRKDGARPLRGVQAPDLCALRDLRVRAFG